MAAGSSSAMRMRFSSSRQESPASTRMRVRLLDTNVLFPLEPEASTVIRIIQKAYARLPLNTRPVAAKVPRAAIPSIQYW